MRLAFDELSNLYDEVDEMIRSASPVCELSARCCRFKEFGHDLFLTSLEHEYLLASGEVAVSRFAPGENCPWQAESGRCTARKGRPLGCRVFFCDPAYAERMPEIMESAMGRLRLIVDRHQIHWDYRPLHKHLLESLADGRWLEPGQAQGEHVGTSHADSSSADWLGQSPESIAKSGDV